MNVSFQIARRYLFGKKRTNAINIITGIAVLGIAIGTTALILILSVFNGFESLSRSYLDKFNPDIKILPATGKHFSTLDSIFTELGTVKGVEGYSKVIEEAAHFEYDDRQQIGFIKGVDEHYLDVIKIDSAIIDGVPIIRSKDRGTYALVGEKIYNSLNIDVHNHVNTLRITVPNPRVRGPMDKDLRSRSTPIAGAYSIKNDRDSRYVIMDFDQAAALLDVRNQLSAIEIKLESPGSSSIIKKRLQQLPSAYRFQILDRQEQDADTLKIMRIEKWTSYLIFSFSLLLIIFNVVGCLWMIVLDKKKDISVLQSMGATKSLVKGIFLREGAMISILGFAIGFVISAVFYILQKTVGIISVPDGFAIKSYPIVMQAGDVIVILITVLVLGVLASVPAAHRAGRISPYVRFE